MQISTSQKLAKKMAMQNYAENARCLKNEDNVSICSICIEKLSDKIILCLACDKYIGHKDCIDKYIAKANDNEIKCPNCQY